MYINAGKSATWGKIKREAERREKAKRTAKVKTKRKKDEHSALIQDLMLVLGVLLGGLCVTAGLIYLIFSGSLD